LHNVRLAERQHAVEQLETALVEDEARRQALEREQLMQELVDEERAEQAEQQDEQPVLVLQDDAQVRVSHLTPSS
jgi:hypothetical protein